MKKLLLLTLLALNTQINAQNVGIGSPAPTEKLDVTGNINVTGTIKANGVAGTAGQVLKSTGSAMAWENASTPATTYAVGDYAQGGVVFYVNAAGTHGKVVIPFNIEEVAWSNVSTIIGNSARNSISGAGSSVAIVTQAGHTNSAANICMQLAFGGYDDWYLPSTEELNLIYFQRAVINATSTENFGSNFLPGFYWTSFETDATFAFCKDFNDGSLDVFNKNSILKLRAVRTF
jgi:Protein of unknown function (DUF1566)